MIRAVLLLALLPVLFAGPIALRLDSLKNSTNVFQIESGGKLFVSSKDNSEVLSNIYFTFDGKNVSATVIAKKYIDGTERKDGFIINSNKLTVINLNLNVNTASLSGAFYVTTAAQATDVNFAVFDNLQPIHITSGQGTNTLVVFNMFKTIDDPQRPNYHGLVKYTVRDSVSYSFNMYFGVPRQPMADVFFQNPIVFTTSSETVQHYFPETEYLPVNTQIFHIKASGAFSISLSPGWNNTKTFTTSLSTTTGLLSTTNDNYLNQTVKFRANVNKRGYTYIRHMGFVLRNFQAYLTKPGGMSSFSLYGGFKETGEYVAKELYSSLALSGPANVGQFFAQYVVIEGTDYIQPTTKSSRLNTTINSMVKTTTKSSSLNTTMTSRVETTKSSRLETTTQSSFVLTWTPIASLLIVKMLL